jgi:hypothetical protein
MPKIYVGKGKTVGNFGQIKLNICLKDFNGNILLTPNDNGYLKPLILTKMKAPDKRGNDYTIYIDDFVLNTNRKSEDIQTGTMPEEDLPF